MTIFLLIVFGSYLVCLLVLLYGWERSLARPISKSDVFQKISVIIPFRNEEKNLVALVQSLKSIQYPANKIEFIFVNDSSSDNSVETLKLLNLSNSKVIELRNEKTGKKAALTKGVESASSEIIVTTDADCQNQSNWLESINSLFSDLNVKMVVGGVAISNPKGLFNQLQAIEFASLIGSGASLLHWQIPAMANGANLAFRKSAFLDVGGYEGNENIPSGDDEYLLRKFFATRPEGVVFNSSVDSVVSTTPQKSLRSFFHQRLRWAGKWKHQTNASLKWTAVFVFLFQLTFLASFFFYWLSGSKLILMLLLSKAALEGILLFRVCQFLSVRFSLLSFALLQIVYPFYVVITAIGSLILPFEWKGRKY
jgi:cellulose synthase/poly-beta-1,6-N-acetylglucosamine synthase-like glycosyltransferase